MRLGSSGVDQARGALFTAEGRVRKYLSLQLKQGGGLCGSLPGVPAPSLPPAAHRAPPASPLPPPCPPPASPGPPPAPPLPLTCCNA